MNKETKSTASNKMIIKLIYRTWDGKGKQVQFSITYFVTSGNKGQSNWLALVFPHKMCFAHIQNNFVEKVLRNVLQDWLHCRSRQLI